MLDVVLETKPGGYVCWLREIQDITRKRNTSCMKRYPSVNPSVTSPDRRELGKAEIQTYSGVTLGILNRIPKLPDGGRDDERIEGRMVPVNVIHPR